MRSMGAVLVWVAGCSASVAAPDTYVGPSDAGIDAPRVRRSDAGLDGAGVWRALDPAIGEARALRGRGAIVEGERGLEYVPFGHHIGPTVRRFDPETEGRSTLPGPLDAIVLERADGVFVVHGQPRLEGFCE